jgi:Uma2 family endonuclease
MGPKVLHQLAVSRLQEIFSEVRPPELLVMADVAVDHRPRFQRDIAIVTKFRIGLELQAIAPELIKLAVEVVSPSSRRRDWIEKRCEYARIGIPNYVLVELPRGARALCLLS